MFSRLRIINSLVAILSSTFLAFYLYHIHSFSGITEGGVLGLTLLLEHWFDISPALSGFILNALCYLLGVKLLGKKFIAYSALSTISFSITYKICELFPPLWPDLYQYPFIASIVGAMFIGIGAGLCVRIGGATSGDDAFAMSIAHLTRIKIQWIYLISDLIVLLLSISYIPLQRLWYSLLTVILSGQIVGLITNFKIPKKQHI